MKISEFTETIEHFFLEIIGVILPGITLIVGILIVLNIQSIDEINIFIFDIIPVWIVLVLLGYILGHLIAGIERRILIPLLIISPISRLFIFKSIRNMDKELDESVEFLSFKNAYQKRHKNLEITTKDSNLFHFFRNIAITIINEHRFTIKEFMFISHFNMGIGTSILLIDMFWIISNITWVHNQFNNFVMPLNIIIIVLLFFTSMFFLDRGFEFYSRSMRLPFSIAISNINDNK